MVRTEPPRLPRLPASSRDGIESFAEAKARAVQEDIFPVANLRDIIASKKASGRMKDKLDLHLLELFRLEYESRKP